MKKESITINSRTVMLYPAQCSDKSLIVLNTYADNGDVIIQHLREMQCPDFNLLVINNLHWNSDMTPWECPSLNKKDMPFSGGADHYLDLLCAEIIPQILTMIAGKPAYTGIAGYSLAGLFALYALYQCSIFDRAASMSGSLWYPHFTEFVQSHSMQKVPEKLYLSLGDAEAKTKHPLMKTVQENTEAIVEHYKNLGIDTAFKLNEGNHFKDAELRTAKGILALLQ